MKIYNLKVQLLSSQLGHQWTWTADRVVQLLEICTSLTELAREVLLHFLLPPQGQHFAMPDFLFTFYLNFLH